MIRLSPSSTRTATRCPITTLFRSEAGGRGLTRLVTGGGARRAVENGARSFCPARPGGRLAVGRGGAGVGTSGAALSAGPRPRPALFGVDRGAGARWAAVLRWRHGEEFPQRDGQAGRYIRRD